MVLTATLLNKKSQSLVKKDRTNFVRQCLIYWTICLRFCTSGQMYQCLTMVRADFGTTTLHRHRFVPFPSHKNTTLLLNTDINNLYFAEARTKLVLNQRQNPSFLEGAHADQPGGRIVTVSL